MGSVESSLKQQGFLCSADELRQLRWALRFTPLVCMAIAIVGLVLRAPWIHFALAALGIVPYWFPAGHPVDRLYNHLLRPLWGGPKLPPNPLPRRVACFMGGFMNLLVGFAFLAEVNTLAYVFGGILIALQLIVITTHFCVASYLLEAGLRAFGRYTRPITSQEARDLIARGAELIDLREPGDFAQGALPGAKNIPYSQAIKTLENEKDRTFVFYCQGGFLSHLATKRLKKAGHPAVYDVGAIGRWERE